MSKLEPRSIKHWIFLSALVVFWGASFAITKLAVATQSPEWTVAIRLVIGAALVWAVMKWQGQSLPATWQHWKWFIWLGAVGSLIPFLLISWGTQFISSGIAGILMAVIPLFIALVGHFFLRDEPLSAIRFAGLLIGFFGLIIILLPDITENQTNGGLALLAEAAILLAAFSYGAQSITARLSPTMHPLQKAAGSLITAAIGSVLIALFFDFKGISTITENGFIFAALLGIFSTALAGIVLFYLLEQAGASFAALSNYLLSPFALFLGIVFMGEPFVWQSFVGLLVILAGIALSEHKAH